ncbi:BTB/POZ domain-containing protein At2g46260 isoform X2 [Cajanus cajan]|uniref:BTB/POZ domain-containing protein At2g46260 isoform X2 n=1 Tax=Cajanus cajan TaxID=3821 RepID=UPI00098D8BC2|nr:BTB/POZ domain-containing protein At2g46260 isoform X2 [Cajanus cajan]
MEESRTDDVGRECNFAFAFNNINFSDRILNLEVIPDPCPQSHSLSPNRKRRRHSLTKGDEISHDSDDSSLGISCSNVLRIRTVHISSSILAAKSPFFYKLFSNVTRESKQQNVTLQIHDSEEGAVMDILNFMYGNTLSRTTSAAVLDVLVAADKFEVTSCMKYCSRILRQMPMTCESALQFLDLPSSILTANAIQPLIETAKLFLATHYRDITKFADEVLNLPLVGIEAVLSSDNLLIPSENCVYNFVLKWARRHYPKIEDRQQVLGSRLGGLIRFPYMGCQKLKKVLTCEDFPPDFASKVVLEALFFKTETPYRQWSLAAQDVDTTCCRFVERTYTYRPVKVVEFALPRPRCVVYLDLKKEECVRLFPNARIYSQEFSLGKQGFLLSPRCYEDRQNSSHCFGLFLVMQFKQSVSLHVEYEFFARSKFTLEYLTRCKGNYTLTAGKSVGHRNLFGIPWTEFIADNSHHFINGLLHLKVELTVRQ